MSRVAMIVALYERPDDVPELAAAIRAQTRPPDELWLLWDGSTGPLIAAQDWGPAELRVEEVVTPRDEAGVPLVVPFAPKLNHALDRTRADLIVYGQDDSRPLPDKIERMAGALDARPDWGAVYCWQARRWHDRPIILAGGLNHPLRAVRGALDTTMVMHRRTAARWPLDLRWLQVADGKFFEDAGREVGPYYPVPDVLDTADTRAHGLSLGWSLGSPLSREDECRWWT